MKPLPRPPRALDLDAAIEAVERLAAEATDVRLSGAADAMRAMRAADRWRIRDQRDVHRLVREMARRFAADFPSVRAQADRLDRIAQRYMRGDWRHHAHRVSAPPEIEGAATEFVWRILAATGRFPTRETIRKILSDR